MKKAAKSITFTFTLWLGIISGLLAQLPLPTPPATKKKPIELEFVPQGGFYEDALAVELFSPGATIYYTTDGSTPYLSSKLLYKGPVWVDSLTTIRAIAVKDKKSAIISHTYFLHQPETTFPVVSLAVDSEVLFDTEVGLFMKGSNAIDTLWKLPGANFWSRREIPVSMEIFETDGQCVYRSLSGFRLFGGMSRLFPQKSFAVVARKRYGQKRIKHKIFGKEGLKKFKYLVFRNSGSDFGKTHFRDALLTSLVEDWDIEKQDYRPSHVYINGDYWGIYNIREKVNRYFLEGHSEVDKDSLDLIEHRLTRKRGSKKHYQRLLNFLERNDLSLPENYAWVASQMEVDNFMNYKIAQIYFDNKDAGGNIKFWRPQTPNGKWRWILYDTDWGFGLHESEAFKNNSLNFHTEPEGPSWPNPPWSTLILRKLLENKDFEKAFITRFCDHLNVSFESFRVEKKIDELYQIFLPEIPRHFERWRKSPKTWQREISKLRNFARERPKYIRMHLMETFLTGEVREVEISTTKGGQVILNEYIKISEPFHGKYFQHLPIQLKAMPNLGYRFSHWEGISLDREVPEISLRLFSKKQKIQAVFEKYDYPLANEIMINEISCNNKEVGDWVEIYNNSKEKVNLKGWIFTDEKNEFQLPNINLLPQDYLILCQDSTTFEKTFPYAYNIVGGMQFGLNKRQETLRLFTNEGAGVDSMRYQIEPMDSIFTLNLLLPWLNNGDPENWEIRKGKGTPTSANPYYVQSTLQAKREQWMQIGGAFAVLLICAMLLFLRKKGRL